MTAPKVTSLQRLRQILFPEIVRIQQNKFLLPPGDDEIGISEREIAAGLIVTICAREGEWTSVPLQSVLNEVAHFTLFSCKARETVLALESLETESLINFVEFQGTMFIEPTPDLARMVIDPLKKGYFI